MIIVLQRKKIAIFILTVMVFIPLFVAAHSSSVSTMASLLGAKREKTVIILDPGHGGEDGGAISPDGIKESDLNLEISGRIQEIFLFCGREVLATRTKDISLDHGEQTIRQRKRADLKSRADFVNGIPQAYLISIHQNSLPQSPITRGAQVFWNQRPGACQLALAVQDTLNDAINDKHKESKKIADTVYLMRSITAPAILVECGFLSNPQETAMLQSHAHQKKLGISIASGFLHWISEEETK